MFNFFKKKNKKSIFKSEGNTLYISIKCDKCGTEFNSHLRKGYDLITDYSTGNFFINKEYICPKCYSKIKLNAVFNGKYQLNSLEIIGGKIQNEE
ncbi:hypothetical protein OSSY52_16290 [Tepiditoga spiralis]|uniref:Uncharacterized protein n=1 Tax=Tepiditoga spiralis TaxID=2108365 RepID=A0A7G1G4N4_9BACT|nr:hypothetical protein [Tepiditoga spiralis]BBE31488.1 hypothetical protein OSSY52_16290 [Tepiditoga spiralis]